MAKIERPQPGGIHSLIFMSGGVPLDQARGIFHDFEPALFTLGVSEQINTPTKVRAAAFRGLEESPLLRNLQGKAPTEIDSLTALIIGIDLKPAMAHFNTQIDQLMQLSAADRDQILTLGFTEEDLVKLTPVNVSDRIHRLLRDIPLIYRLIFPFFRPKEQHLHYEALLPHDSRVDFSQYLGAAYTPEDRVRLAISSFHLTADQVAQQLFPGVDLNELKTTNPAAFRKAHQMIGRYITSHQIYYRMTIPADKHPYNSFKVENGTVELGCPARASVLSFHEGLAAALHQNFASVLAGLDV